MGDASESVLAHLRTVIKDNQVKIDVVEVYEPSPLSPYSIRRRQGRGVELIEATIREVFPDAVPAPYVMMAATDSRTFSPSATRSTGSPPFG